jgi:hypothetical protein
VSYPEEPQPPNYRADDAGPPESAPVSAPVPVPVSAPVLDSGWSAPVPGVTADLPGPPAGWTASWLGATSGWSPPGGAPRDPATAGSPDRTPPYAQAAVRLRPARPDPRHTMPPYRPAPYPAMPRTLPVLPPGYVPHVPRYPYGYAVRPAFPSGYARPVPAENSGLCVASMIFGILGLVFLCCDFGVLSLIAVIVGHLGLAQTHDGNRAGNGFGVAGLVLGYAVLVPAFVLSFFVVVGSTLSGLQ